MRTALVTGGQGFIGKHLVNTLRRRDIAVTTVGRRHAEGSHIVLAADSWSASSLRRLLEQVEPECVFHLAGAARGTRAALEHTNVDLTRALLQAVKDVGFPSLVVVAGSAAEYGTAVRDGVPVRETDPCRPVSDYGITKHEQTKLALAHAQASGLPILVVRIFNPIGPEMPAHLALGDFARQIASMPEHGGTLHVGNIDTRRDMIDVEHAAQMIYRLAETPAARGAVVNVCSGQAPPLRDLVEMLIALSGRKVSIVVDSARVRANEIQAIIGSVELLAKLGCPPPPTDFLAVLKRIWQAAERSRSSV